MSIFNIISLFGLSSPTANLSVTLLLAFITWVLIQITELKFQGLGGYLHSFLEPIPVMLPMNIFGKFSTILSAIVTTVSIICGKKYITSSVAKSITSLKTSGKIGNTELTVFVIKSNIACVITGNSPISPIDNASIIDGRFLVTIDIPLLIKSIMDFANVEADDIKSPRISGKSFNL